MCPLYPVLLQVPIPLRWIQNESFQTCNKACCQPQSFSTVSNCRWQTCQGKGVVPDECFAPYVWVLRACWKPEPTLNLSVHDKISALVFAGSSSDATGTPAAVVAQDWLVAPTHFDKRCAFAIVSFLTGKPSRVCSPIHRETCQNAPFLLRERLPTEIPLPVCGR